MKKGRIIITFTFLSRGCYGLIDFFKKANTENLYLEIKKHQRLGFYGNKLNFLIPMERQ